MVRISTPYVAQAFLPAASTFVSTFARLQHALGLRTMVNTKPA
jgi:hypothetical protein